MNYIQILGISLFLGSLMACNTGLQSGLTPIGPSSTTSQPGQKGCTIIDFNDSTQNFLHVAAILGREQAVKSALESGVPSHQDKQGNTPLAYAIRYKNLLAAQVLISWPAINDMLRQDYIAFYYAIIGGYTDIVQEFLRKGMQVNLQDQYGKNPLHWATYQGHVDVVKLLLKNRGNTNAQDQGGLSPLHYAARHGHIAVVEELLGNKEIQVNLIDLHDRRTALHWAAFYGHTAVVQLLLKNGANINAQDEYGFSALHCAVRNNHITVVQELFRNKEIQVNLIDQYDHRTALHWAAFYGFTEICQQLLTNQVSIYAQDKSGRTALALVDTKHHSNTYQLLKKFENC